MACRLMSLITQSFARSFRPALTRPSTCTQCSPLPLQSSLPMPQEEWEKRPALVGWCSQGQSWRMQLLGFIFAVTSMLCGSLIFQLINSQWTVYLKGLLMFLCSASYLFIAFATSQNGCVFLFNLFPKCRLMAFSFLRVLIFEFGDMDYSLIFRLFLKSIQRTSV